MKKVMLVLLLVFVAATVAMAQPPQYTPTSDVLGAHLVYGRGCVACHSSAQRRSRQRHQYQPIRPRVMLHCGART